MDSNLSSAEPSVDVILPVYGEAPWVEEAVVSVVRQSYSRWHLYIVQDGPEGARPLQGALEVAAREDAGGKITSVRLSDRRGAPGARMEAIATYSRGDIVAFIDQDDVWAPTKLEKQVAVFKEFPAVSLVHTDATRMCYTPEGITYVPDRHNVRRAGIDYGAASPVDLASQFLYGNSVRLCSVAVRRRDFVALGGFDASLFGGEEEEFLGRASAAGLRFHHLRDPLLYRRFHGASTSSRYVSRRLAGKWEGQTRLVERCPSLKGYLPSARRRLVLVAVRRALVNGEWEYAERLARAWRSEGHSPAEALFLETLTRIIGRVLQGRNIRRPWRGG